MNKATIETIPTRPCLRGGNMPICPECESPLDFEADEVEEGDVVVCDECGTEFEVIATEPLEIVKVEDGYEDEEGEPSGEEGEEE
jgi:alpha-aminoadipate/glutamate carrier protein LysW